MMAFTRTGRVGCFPLRRLTATLRSGGASAISKRRWESTKENVPTSATGLSGSNSRSTDEKNVDSATTMTGWTVREALEASIQRLTQKSVTEPDYSALYLMAASLELPWERGIRDLHHGSSSNEDRLSATLTAPQASHLEELLQRREQHEPIQYVLGQWDFLEYTVAIRKPLLCPRPETEELVMMVVEDQTETNHHQTKKDSCPLRILDVGCGTGVIGISLAHLLQDATVEAIDVEPVAIETSMENAQRVLGNKDHPHGFYQATLVSAGEYTPDRPFDVVVSNPPYIPRSDMDGLTHDVTGHESDTALCGGIDGLDVIKTIIEKLPEWCNPNAVCWMEVDPSHPKLIEEFLAANNASSQQEPRSRIVKFESSHQDMFGKDRFVKLRVV